MRRLGLFLTISLFGHALLLGFFPQAKTRTADASRREPVKVRIVVSEKKPLPLPEAPKSPPRAAAPRRPGPSRAKVSKPSASAPSGASRIETYADLFPKAGEGSDAAAVVTVPRAVGGAPSFDPEGDAYAFEVQAKSLARLEGFARELAGRIAIPFAVKRLQASGKAFVRISRGVNGGWQVAAVSGDPYFRAILYDVLAELAPQSQLAMLLNDTAYPSVRIYLDLSAVSALDLTAKPVVTSTSSNKVFVSFTHGRADPAWQLAAPIDNAQGDDAVGWNLIGTGMFVWDKLHQTDPNEDVDVKRLRLSPAFARPIGR